MKSELNIRNLTDIRVGGEAVVRGANQHAGSTPASRCRALGKACRRQQVPTAAMHKGILRDSEHWRFRKVADQQREKLLDLAFPAWP